MKPILRILGALALTNLATSALAAPWVTNSPLNLARYSCSSTLLLARQVLIAGGAFNEGSSTNNVELYSPATGVNRLANPMLVARMAHTATLMLNGQVLVTGGLSGEETLSEAVPG